MKPRAARHIREATTWLSLNSSPEAVLNLVLEIEETLRRLQRLPSLGPPVTNARTRGVRRIHLPTESYHVYYRVNEKQTLLEVLALRHTRRGGRAGV